MISFVRIIGIFTTLVLLVSCGGTPVRHLASDASLVVVGSSTKSDVLTVLGDPDDQQVESDTVERWIYHEERASGFQKTPYVGKMFGVKSHSRIIVTFKGDIVSDCKYFSYDPHEFDWSDDYSWQEKKP